MAAVGQLVAGRYRVIRPLAAGGMSQVWLAADQLLDRPVAIKKCALPDGLTADEQELVGKWTLREARAFARVSHPNVISIVDVLPDADEPWIVMEYVPSRSLLQVIEESGPLPPARVATIGLAVLTGLNAVLRAGVLHLDVKPANVLIADDGRVVLSDFGPAVTNEGIGALAGAGIILGSPNYVAPERLFDGVSTARADLWSLGATLYHAVEGRPPYARATTEVTLQALADSPPDPSLRAGPLADVLRGLLQRDPAARPAAPEVEDRLRRLADEPERLTVGAYPGPAAVGASETLPRRVRPMVRRRAAALAAMLAVIATLVTGAAGTRANDQASSPPARPVIAAHAPVVLPASFGWWNDPTGFRVAVPSGWRRSRDGGGLVFSAPRGRTSLRISTWTPQPRNVAAALIAEEHNIRLAAYRRIRIETLPEPPDAVWEYTYRDPSAGPMRGLRRVLTDDGHMYVIEWRASRATWAAESEKLAVVLASFGPLPGE